MKKILLGSGPVWGLLGVVLAGCQSVPHYASFKQSPVYQEDFHKVWQIVKEVVQRDWELEEVDNEGCRLVSKWDEMAAPQNYAGQRRQVTAEVLRQKEGVSVQVKVQLDRNENIKSPQDLTQAKWVARGSDSAAERQLLWRIHSRLSTFQPSPELLRRLEWEEEQNGTPPPRR